jgi:hypothetical protein
MSDDIRKLIDEAKASAETQDNSTSLINTPDGWIPIKRTVRKSVKPEDVDPSNVKVAPDRELVAMLVAQLHDIRAQKRELDDRDSAIKDILQEMAGEIEYMALEEGERPVISLKHEQSLRLNTARIKELMPADENPELYTTINSRPLRLI